MDQRRPWAVFVLLSLIWGSSFLFIKIALDDLPPLTLVGFRLLFGVAFLLPLTLAQRQHLPRGGRTWLQLAFIGLTGTAMPFALITWGEQTIDSGLASVLNGTVPLFSIIIADLWLRDGPITAGRVAGLVGGFVGVIILVGGGLSAGAGNLSQLAVVAAAGCYATSTAFIRRWLGHLKALPMALAQLLVATVLVWLMVALVERPAILAPATLFTGRSLFAVAWLGVMGSGLAYVLFYYLVGVWGSTRSTLVTYAIPVVGVALGMLVLDEPLTWRLLAGGALVVGGIGLVNLRPAG